MYRIAQLFGVRKGLGHRRQPAWAAIAVILAAVPSPAQIVDDPVNDAIFVIGGTSNTVTTNLGSRRVFVGKDDLASFTTLAGPITLTIGPGGIVDGWPPLTAPDGRRYSGVNVFGPNRIEMLGGTVSRMAAFDSSVISMTGGWVGDLDAYGASSVTLSGGTATLRAFEGGQVTMSGGSGSVSLSDAASGRIDGAADAFSIWGVNAYGTSTLTVAGSGLNTTPSNERWGLDPTTGLGRVADYHIIGLLADGTAIDQTITASASGSSISGGEVVLRGMSLVQTNPLYFTADGTADAFGSLVTVGRSADGTVQASPTVTLEAGLSTGIVTVLNNSVVVMNGGEILGRLDVLGASQATMNGGTSENVTVGADATFHLVGGQVHDTVRGVGNGVATISGGSTDIAWAFDDSTITITGGYARDATSSGGTVNINGGQVGMSFSNGAKAVVNVNGGTVGTSDPYSFGALMYGGTINVNGGVVRGSYSAIGGYGNLTVTGGTIAGRVDVGSGLLAVTGGHVQSLAFQESATISGGTFGSILPRGDSVLDLLGSGLQTTAGPERWSFDFAGQKLGRVADYRVVGTLADGTPLDHTIEASSTGALSSTDSVRLLGTSHVVAPDLVVTSGGSVTGAYSRLTIDGAAATLDAVLDVGIVDVQGGSSVTMNAGTIHGSAYVLDSSVLTILGGDARVAAYNSALVDIRGGRVGYLDVSGDASATISGGTVMGSSAGSLFGFGRGHVDLVGGEVSGSFWLFEQSRLDVFGHGLGFNFDTIGGEDGFGPYARYVLFGTLLDGRSIDGLLLYDFLDGVYDIGGDPALSPLWFNGQPASVPEIDPAAFSSVLALVGAGLGLLERRRGDAREKRRGGGAGYSSP